MLTYMGVIKNLLPVNELCTL